MGKPPSKSEQLRRSSRVRPVKIADMRRAPAGITQRKFRKSQAEEYASSLDINKLGIPVVNLRNSIFWILDGQHRIAALQMFFGDADPGSIDCEVYEDLTDAEMADIFLGRDDRRPISVFEKFFVAVTAAHQRECEVLRVVETQGLKVSKTKADGCVGSVSALLNVFDAAGSNVLGQVLRTARDAFASTPIGFDTMILQGLGLVFNRYNGRTNERDLSVRLSAFRHGAGGVLKQAEAMREKTGNLKAQCVAATIVDIYNKGAQKRLPSWWKTQEAA